MKSDFYPELDDSKELTIKDNTMYQELIGELRWAIELGRLDIFHEVSLPFAYHRHLQGREVY